MTEIINEQQYEVAMQRIEELLPLVDDNTPTNDRNYIELDMISSNIFRNEGTYSILFNLIFPSSIINLSDFIFLFDPK